MPEVQITASTKEPGVSSQAWEADPGDSWGKLANYISQVDDLFLFVCFLKKYFIALNSQIKTLYIVMLQIILTRVWQQVQQTLCYNVSYLLYVHDLEILL